MTEAIHLNPRNARAFVDGALAYTLLGDGEAAWQALDRAEELGLDPTYLEGEFRELNEQR